MEYAVIKAGGKQYKVSTGDVIEVELFPGKEEGDSVELPTLAAQTGSEFLIGTPELSETTKATILRATRGKKVMVFKKRRRTTYRKKNGHRQGYHELRIESIPGV